MSFPFRFNIFNNLHTTVYYGKSYLFMYGMTGKHIYRNGLDHLCLLGFFLILWTLHTISAHLQFANYYHCWQFITECIIITLDNIELLSGQCLVVFDSLTHPVTLKKCINHEDALNRGTWKLWHIFSVYRASTLI